MDDDFALLCGWKYWQGFQDKKNSFQSPSLVKVLNIFVKILCICTLYTKCQLHFLSHFNSLHSFFCFSLVKESDLLSA